MGLELEMLSVSLAMSSLSQASLEGWSARVLSRALHEDEGEGGGFLRNHHLLGVGPSALHVLLGQVGCGRTQKLASLQEQTQVAAGVSCALSLCERRAG